MSHLRAPVSPPAGLLELCTQIRIAPSTNSDGYWAVEESFLNFVINGMSMYFSIAPEQGAPGVKRISMLYNTSKRSTLLVLRGLSNEEFNQISDAAGSVLPILGFLSQTTWYLMEVPTGHLVAKSSCKLHRTLK